MKLLLLGTSGYHPSEQRQTACLMLPEVGIVLDAGTGFFRVRQHRAITQRPMIATPLTGLGGAHKRAPEDDQQVKTQDAPGVLSKSFAHLLPDYRTRLADASFGAEIETRVTSSFWCGNRDASRVYRLESPSKEEGAQTFGFFNCSDSSLLVAL